MVALTDGKYLQLGADIASVAGFVVLWMCGDASHVSFKTIELMFVHSVLSFPPFFASGYSRVSIMHIIRYCVNILVFLFILGPYRRRDAVKRTYRPLLDSFPLHWLLILPPIAVTVLMFLFLGKGVGGCTPSSFQPKVDCTYNVLYSVGYCLTPLMFLPLLYVWRKLSMESTALNFNVRFFVSCMVVMVFLFLAIDIFVQPGYWTLLGICTNGLTLLLLMAPSVKNALYQLVCNKELKADNGTTGAGDVELPETAGSGGMEATTPQDEGTKSGGGMFSFLKKNKTESTSAPPTPPEHWEPPSVSVSGDAAAMATTTTTTTATDKKIMIVPDKKSGGGMFSFLKKKKTTTESPSGGGAGGQNTTDDFSSNWLT